MYLKVVLVWFGLFYYVLASVISRGALQSLVSTKVYPSINGFVVKLSLSRKFRVVMVSYKLRAKLSGICSILNRFAD